jgi:hypothetical protein
MTNVAMFSYDGYTAASQFCKPDTTIGQIPDGRGIMFKVIGATVVYSFASFGFYKWWKAYKQERPCIQRSDNVSEDD